MRYQIQLQSTALASAEYDEDSRSLEITFTSGRSFTYDNVPLHVFEGLRDDPSPGSYYHREIKNKY